MSSPLGYHNYLLDESEDDTNDVSSWSSSISSTSHHSTRGGATASTGVTTGLPVSPALSITGYQFQPVVAAWSPAGAPSDDEIDEERRQDILERFGDLKWCVCHRCQVAETVPQNVCCKKHDTISMKAEGLTCILDHPGVDQLLEDAPLEMAYNSFLAFHDEIFPSNPSEADLLRKKRFCAYRNLVFWFYPGIKKRVRRPLSACLYAYIQARFPPTQNEEDFANYQFSKFTYSHN